MDAMITRMNCAREELATVTAPGWRVMIFADCQSDRTGGKSVQQLVRVGHRTRQPRQRRDHQLVAPASHGQRFPQGRTWADHPGQGVEASAKSTSRWPPEFADR